MVKLLTHTVTSLDFNTIEGSFPVTLHSKLLCSTFPLTHTLTITLTLLQQLCCFSPYYVFHPLFFS